MPSETPMLSPWKSSARRAWWNLRLPGRFSCILRLDAEVVMTAQVGVLDALQAEHPTVMDVEVVAIVALPPVMRSPADVNVIHFTAFTRRWYKHYERKQMD